MSVIEICLTSPANWVNYIFISLILILVMYAHRSNIIKLFTGKENKTELLAMLKKITSKKKDSNNENIDKTNMVEIENQNSTNTVIEKDNNSEIN